MKITILLGSVRPERQSHRLAYYLQKRLLEKGFKTELVDLMHQPLPIYGQSDGIDSNVESISKLLLESDGLLFVTPEYHGTFSGVLKNALEFYWEEFSNKPIGVAAASGGKMGGINASTQLQHVILSLGAFPMPKKLLVPEIQNAFDDNFTPLSQHVIKSTDLFLKEYIWFAQTISNKKEKEESLA